MVIEQLLHKSITILCATWYNRKITVKKTQNHKLYITVLTASYDMSQKQKSTFFHQTTALQKYYSKAQPGIRDHMWVMVIEQLLHYSPDCTL